MGFLFVLVFLFLFFFNQIVDSGKEQSGKGLDWRKSSDRPGESSRQELFCLKHNGNKEEKVTWETCLRQILMNFNPTGCRTKEGSRVCVRLVCIRGGVGQNELRMGV